MGTIHLAISTQGFSALNAIQGQEPSNQQAIYQSQMMGIIQLAMSTQGFRITLLQ